MISHRYKCIFVHIPKNGGTSIESILGHLEGHQGREGQDHRSLRMMAPKCNPKIFLSATNILEFARSIKYKFQKQVNPNNRLTVTREQYNNYFKFSVVRNPWARAFSWYKNVMRDEIHRIDLKITGEITLNQFLHRFIGKGMLRPQTYWIKDFNNSIPLDYICRFENLNDDFSNVSKRIGLEPMILPHKIKGSGEDYREQYDEESIQLIADYYQEEIELFKYQFRK